MHCGAEHRGIPSLSRTDDVETALQFAKGKLDGALRETGKKRRDVAALHVEYVDAGVHRGGERHIQGVVCNRVLNRGRGACRDSRNCGCAGNRHVFAAHGNELEVEYVDRFPAFTGHCERERHRAGCRRRKCVRYCVRSAGGKCRCAVHVVSERRFKIHVRAAGLERGFIAERVNRAAHDRAHELGDDSGACPVRGGTDVNSGSRNVAERGDRGRPFRARGRREG